MTKKISIPASFYRTLEHALDDFSPHEVFYLEYLALNLSRLLQSKLPNNPRMLDIGCGYGVLTRLMQILCSSTHAYGVDTQQEPLTYAQKVYPSMSFKKINNDTLPFENHTFDLVYANEVFHHIPHEKHALYCKEIDRVLKPGGIALIIELNPYNLFTRRAFARDPYEQGLTMLPPWYIKNLLKPYGKTTTYYFGFFQQWFISLRSIETYISKVPLGSIYVVTLKKIK